MAPPTTQERARCAVDFLIHGLLATEEHVWDIVTPTHVLRTLKMYIVDEAYRKEQSLRWFFGGGMGPCCLELTNDEFNYAEEHCTVELVESMKATELRRRVAAASDKFHRATEQMEVSIHTAIRALFPRDKPSRMVYPDGFQDYEARDIFCMLQKCHVAEYERILDEYTKYHPQDDTDRSLHTLIKAYRHTDYVQTLLDDVCLHVRTKIDMREWDALNYDSVIAQFEARMQHLPADDTVERMYWAIKIRVPARDAVSMQALQEGCPSSPRLTVVNLKRMLQRRGLLAAGCKAKLCLKLGRVFGLCVEEQARWMTKRLTRRKGDSDHET